jgi:alkanesulfonate monooxygenase SsuD/methylene tetrahydromethanopterin reductase-like flavin-dependent oxidoreductase (luciferase family)
LEGVEAIVQRCKLGVDLLKTAVDTLEALVDPSAQFVQPPIRPFLNHRLHDDCTIGRNVLSVVELALGKRHDFPHKSYAIGFSAMSDGQGRGFGVAAGLDPAVARPLAERCADLGHGSMWSNDHPGAKGLETLAEFRAAAPDLDLGVAVIALDRQRPAEIAADVERLGLAPAHLWLGVGAGFGEKPLTRMREDETSLREALPTGVRLVLAAMGPKMCELAGEKFDGAFFNWMTPEYAAGARKKVEAGAQEAGRDTPPVFGYVRTAVGPDATERLAKEESFYRDLHPGYRNHFTRLAEPEGTVGVAAADAEEARAQLSAYEALDTVVVRGLASANIDAMSAVAEAAAP